MAQPPPSHLKYRRIRSCKCHPNKETDPIVQTVIAGLYNPTVLLRFVLSLLTSTALVALGISSIDVMKNRIQYLLSEIIHSYTRSELALWRSFALLDLSHWPPFKQLVSHCRHQAQC